MFVKPYDFAGRALSDSITRSPYYKPEDFVDADFTSLGKAAAYLAEKGETLGPAFQKLIDIQRRLRG